MPDLLTFLTGVGFGASVMSILECVCFLAEERRIPFFLKILTVASISLYAASQGWLTHA